MTTVVYEPKELRGGRGLVSHVTRNGKRTICKREVPDLQPEVGEKRVKFCEKCWARFS